MNEKIPQPTRPKWRLPALVTGVILSSLACGTLAFAVKSYQSDYELQIMALQKRGCAIIRTADSSVYPFGGTSMDTVFARRNLIRENWGIWEGRQTLLKCPNGSEFVVDSILLLGLGGYENQTKTLQVIR